MKRRFFSVLLAVLMVVNCLGAFNFSFAAGDVYEYIVGVDVGAIDPAFTLAFGEGDYVRADALSNAALGIFEAELKSALPGVQVVDRITLLSPGVVVRASSDEIDKIELMKYVSKVYENIKYDAPATLQPVRTRSRRSIQPMSTGALNTVYKFVDSRYTGKGSVVAVVDSMMNPNHPAFADVSKIDEVVTESNANAVQNGSYINKKIPFAWNYATNDHNNLNPMNTTNGHGQHVAGIAAGNRTKLMGMDWQGVAPDAQLLLMNIAANSKTISSDGILNALGDALKLKSNVVNMSLGIPKAGYTNKASIDMERVIKPLVDAGIVVAVAAGNSGDVSKLNLSTDNPDLNSLANPANSDNVLTVASNLNNTEYVNKIECTTEKKEGSEGGQLISTSKLEFEYEICNDEFAQSGDYKPASSLDDLDKLNTSDNVLWIGELGAYKKLTDENKAKVDVLLFDSWQSSEGINIPIISSPNVKTLQDDKEYIKNLTLKFLGKTPQDPNRMSDFTSWGIAPEGSLKPDISAPGDRVLSLNNNKGLYLSQGTSMATPVVSGAVAIFNEYFKSSPFKALTGKDKADIIKTVLMNSATPIKSGEMIASPRQQGAGMLNVDNATKIDFTVVDAQSNIASKFVGDVEDNINLNLKIKNWSGSAKKLTARAEILVQNNTNKKMELSSKVSKTVALDGINLDANGEITKDFNINISDVDVSAYQNGAFVDGFLYLNDGTKEISFPFASFKKVNGRKLSNLAAIEKPIYDFKFTDESPMYWEFAQKAGETYWHYLSTHIQSGNKIAGVKNFEEINEKVKQRAQDLRSSNTKDNPFDATNPEFQLHNSSLIFSKNNPVANTSEFTPYIVALRAGKFKTYIKNGDSEIEPAEFFIEVNNIETKPFAAYSISDTTNPIDAMYNGVTRLKSVNISTLADGKYSYVIEAKPFKGALKRMKNQDGKITIEEPEYYDLQSFEIPFIIDNTAPDVLDKKINANTISFKVKDANGIGEVKIGNTVVKPKSKNADNTEAIYEYTVANENLQTLNADADNMQALEISAKDIAENTKTIKLSDVPEKVIKEITVNFSLKGNEIEPIKLKEGQTLTPEKIKEISEIKNVGYNLDGWYTDANFAQDKKIDLQNHQFTEETTLYAKLVAIEYNVRIKVITYGQSKPYYNGVLNQKVSLDNPSLDFVSDSVDNIIKTNKRPGGHKLSDYKVFEKYNVPWKQFINGKKFQPFSKDHIGYLINGELLVEVMVRDRLYNVTFVKNNGEKDTISKETFNSKVGRILYYTDHHPVKEGSVFLGWYTDIECTNKVNDDTRVLKDMTLYAKWDVNKYNVVFMDGDTEYKKEIVEHGTELPAPTAPTKDGYDFVEWQIDGAKATFPIKVKSNITLKAVWKIKTYTVKFEGTDISDAKVDYNQNVTQPQDPTKDGSTFAGWFADAGYRAAFNFTTPISKDTTIYAKWDVNEYRVLIVDGEDINEEKTVKHGEKLQKPATPTKDGYDFVGWYADAELTKEFDFNEPIKEEKMIYAKWKIKTYTVTFDGVDEAAQTVEHGKQTTQPQAPTKEGSTFVGWYQDAGYTTEYDFTTPITKNTTIYAKWDVNKYNVVFMDGENKLEEKTVEHGTELQSPTAPTKDGYDFVGWKNGENDVTFPIKVTENLTLNAVWKIKTFTVKFEGTDISDATVDYNQKVTQPQAPTKEGGTFAGWFADAGYTTAFDFTKPITKNTTIYAKWDVNKYNVVFMDGENKLEEKTVEHGTELQAPEAPTKDGYDFMGWKNGENDVTFPIKVTENLTLNAVWKIKTFTVKFEGTDISDATVDYNQKVTQPQDPTKEGSTFIGWFSDAGYRAEFDFTKPITKNTTIYAKWIKKIFVSYEFVSDNSKTLPKAVNDLKPVAVEKLVGDKVTPAQLSATEIIDGDDKWTFEGYDKDELIVVDGENKFVGTWKWHDNRPSFIITIDADNGSEVSSVSIKKGESFEEPEAPTKEGYDFVEWQIDGAKATFPITITNNITLKAVWEIKRVKVKITFDFKQATMENKVVEIEKGKNLEEPEFERKIKIGDDDYEFDAWYEDEAFTTKADLTKGFDKDTTLYAKWNKVKKPVPQITMHKVSFVDGSATKVVEVEDGKKVNEPQKPQKAEHEFLGWFDGSDKFDFDTEIKSDITLVAKWKKIVKPQPEPQPQPKPEPSPTPEPYVPQPYEPYKPLLPGGRYEPAPKYEPKQQPKAEPKKEVKKEDKKVEEKVQPVHEVKPITVMAPTLPVELTDIPATETGDAIRNMVARGVLKGTGADKFEPETTITRSMVTEVFMRIATDKNIDTAQEFTDVKQEDWYNNSVKWAASKNIIKGFEDGTFKPNQKVTAQEFAVMLKRMLDIYKIEMPNQKAIDEGKYQALQEWSKESVIKVLEKGLIEETDAPIETREITRAELAKALDMIIKFIEQQ